MAGNVVVTVSRALTKPSISNAVLKAVKQTNGHGYRSMSSSALSRTLACRHTARSAGLLRTSTCSYSQISSKGDQELADFLVEEIEAEKKARKSAQLPKIEGFDVKLEGSEVTLTRAFNQETITVRLNVNHSVDAEDAEEFSANQESAPEPGEMKSKPNFTVEIERGGKKLFFSCTFNEGVEPEGQSENYADSFGVTEFAIYEGEWTDEVYTVSGDIMDGYLYDLLMNMLEERGISSEFGYNLVNFCTVYEHSLYIGLLEKLKVFVSKK